MESIPTLLQKVPPDLKKKVPLGSAVLEAGMKTGRWILADA